MTYSFAAFQLDVARQLLTGPEGPIDLPDILFNMLLLLVRAQGEIVTRDALVAEVWNDGFVADATINQHIFRLRKLLRDASGDTYIVTEPGRGYRLNAEVTAQ